LFPFLFALGEKARRGNFYDGCWIGMVSAKYPLGNGVERSGPFIFHSVSKKTAFLHPIDFKKTPNPNLNCDFSNA
jgi:hypothetical protein